MFTTAGVGGVGGGGGAGGQEEGMPIFLDANFSFVKEGWCQKILYDVGGIWTNFASLI